MPRSLERRRKDALAIWAAGLNAVAADKLVRDSLEVRRDLLIVADEYEIPIPAKGRIVVVGAGKAGVGMARGLEAALGAPLLQRADVKGWINVPADCVPADGNSRRIHLHPARPAGKNEPTEAGIQGAEEILKLVGSMTPNDICISLISGGGSALLPSPIDGVSLEDKRLVTQHLSAAGAPIEDLNCVRKKLSKIKGGGLAQACRAGRLISLIISDVLGDPLDVIASGPTVLDRSTPEQALEILLNTRAAAKGVGRHVLESLAKQSPPGPIRGEELGAFTTAAGCVVTNHVIGNNATAVDAAGMEAERRGYSHAMVSTRQSEGEAEGVGRHLAETAMHMKTQKGPDCLISGGEPVVRLADPFIRGRGGRNQQLVLAAMQAWTEEDAQGVTILSGGTDGEDGPTDAAGAIADEEVVATAARKSMDLADYLRRNDAYTCMRKLGALLKTGPTHTNVCDLRVVLVDRVELDGAIRLAGD